MKKLYHIILLFIVVISSCSKSGNSTTDTYTVTGDSDIIVRQYSDTIVTATYHVVFPAGIYEPVTINIGGLPPGVTVTPATATDTTSFSIMVSYHLLMTAAASFPVTITIFSGSFGQKTFQFNIIVTPNVPFTYTLSGLHDITIPRYADTIIHIHVTTTYNSGINEPVATFADGLPTGITVSPASITGTPAYTDSFAFHIKANTSGTLPVTLHSTSSQGTKVSSFNINVDATSDCALPLTGNYSVNTVCNSYSSTGTGGGSGQVYTDGTNKVLIHFPLANIVADLNCNNGTINTEPVSSGSYTVSGGTGSFNATVIILNYAVSGSINSTCTTTLTKQ